MKKRKIVYSSLNKSCVELPKRIENFIKKCKPYKKKKQTNKTTKSISKSMNFYLFNKKYMDFRSQTFFNYFLKKLVFLESSVYFT